MKSLSHRECVEVIKKQIKAKGVCSEDDRKSLDYHERLSKEDSFDAFVALKNELIKPFEKLLNQIGKFTKSLDREKQ